MGAKQSLHAVAQELGLNEQEAEALHALFSSLAGDGSELSEAAARDLFDCRCNGGFGTGMYAIMAKDGPPVTFEKFARAVVDGCRQQATGLLRYYLKAVDPSHRSGQPLSRDTVVSFLMLAYELADGQAYERLASTSHKIFDDIKSHTARFAGESSECADDKDAVDEVVFISWANQRASFLPQVFSSWMTKRVFSSVPIPGFNPFQLPVFLEHQSTVISQADAFYLAIHEAQIQGVWTRLYTSDFDGLSFNRLVHHVLGYDGPSVTVIRATDGAVFGGFNPSRWKLSNSFYGTSDAFLFRLEPTRAIYKPRPQTNGNFVYLNSKGYALQHGLAFGGTTEQFRILIPETFENCTSGNSCLTYESGPLATASTFEIETVEVWGCGGKEVVDHALAAQDKTREDTAAAIRRARTVDKAQFVNNEFDKEFLLSRTFGKK